MLPAFLTTVLFSLSAVCGNRAAKLLGGTEANFWRLCFATALLAVYAHTCGRGLSGNAFPIFLVSGCVGFGVGDMALFQALPRLGSRLSVMLSFSSCCMSTGPPSEAIAPNTFLAGSIHSGGERSCAS